MKIINKICLLMAGLMLLLQTSCTDDFAELNTNPKSLPQVAPEQLLYTAITDWANSGHCWINWASKTRWMQYGVSIWGYGPTGYTYFGNDIGNRLYEEYIRMGGYVTNMEYLSSISEKPDSYKDLNAAARILLIAKSIQVSDLFGSLAYTEGWQARNGKADEASLLPKFDTQEELVAIWDQQLKECIATLKAQNSGQVSLLGQDRAYNGDTKKWVKAGNAVRLRLASRLLNRQPEVAKSIAAEVLAPGNSEYVMGATDDSFIFWFDVLYTNIHGGDWHSSRDMLIASRAFMNYLKNTNDPRKRMFFVINNLTPENIAAYNLQTPANPIPTTFTRWEGATASRIHWTAGGTAPNNWPADAAYTNKTLGTGSDAVNVRAANTPQSRLWKGNDNSGGGGNWAPVVTYSDFCFLASEFVLTQGIASGKSAQQWYEDGVRASLKQWNELGKYCDILNYEAMTQTEIDAFLAHPDIAWDNSKALEQIRAQAWVEHFRDVDESWAQWKRTSYPNKDANIIKFEVPYPEFENVPGIVPRRVKFVYPNEGVQNYENLKKRLDDMVADSQFGIVDSEWGRVWWDK
jgi:hypothetical protein